MSLLAFHLVSLYDPLPPHTRPVGTGSDVGNILWWLITLFVVGIIVTFVSIPRQWVVARLGLKRRTEAYYERTRDVILESKILQTITNPIPSKLMTRAKRLEKALNQHQRHEKNVKISDSVTVTRSTGALGGDGPQEGSHVTISSPPPPNKSTREDDLPSLYEHKRFRTISSNEKSTPQSTRHSFVPTGKSITEIRNRMFGNLALSVKPAPKTTTKMVLLQPMLHDAEAVQRRPIYVCEDKRPLETVADARYLGMAIFDYFTRYSASTRSPVLARSTGENSDKDDNKPQEPLLDMEVLEDFFVNDEDGCKTKLNTLFDFHKRRKLKKSEIVDACVRAFLNRKNLSSSLSDLESIITAINGFLIHAQLLFLFLVLIVAFSSGSQNVLSDAAVTAGTTLIGLSFIFSTATSNMLNSFMFLFARHPYDTGDRVVVMGVTGGMYVTKMSLHATEFTIGDGSIMTIPNHILYAREITNIRRAKAMRDSLELTVDADTPVWKLNQLEDVFFKCLRDHPDDFDANSSSFLYSALTESSRLVIDMSYLHKSTFQNGEQVFRKSLLVRTLKVGRRGWEGFE